MSNFSALNITNSPTPQRHGLAIPNTVKQVTRLNLNQMNFPANPLNSAIPNTPTNSARTDVQKLGALMGLTSLLGYGLSQLQITGWVVSITSGVFLLIMRRSLNR